jgi:hypothetical protein
VRIRHGGVRVIVGMLVLLTLLPFTAPFRVCDAGAIGHSRSRGGAHGDDTSTVNLLADSASAHALPLLKPSARIPIAAVPASKAQTHLPPYVEGRSSLPARSAVRGWSPSATTALRI